MAKNYRMYLGGKWKTSRAKIEVENPWDDSTVGVVSAATEADYKLAIGEAEKAFDKMRAIPAHKRAKILLAIAEGITAKRSALSKTISREMGKVIKDAQAEVDRAAEVFAISAEEAKRLGGEVLDLDAVPAGENKLGIVRRFPIGVVAAITPFNFPLNLVAHKLAPALAAGNTVIVKPSERAPLSALLLGQILDEVGLPPGAVSILPGLPEECGPLLKDPRIRLISFTGSADVGWDINAKAVRKKVMLELGGNAAVIVAEDANVEHAVKRIAFGGYSQSGQSCVSVQRVYAHPSVKDELCDKLTKAVKALKFGNPLELKTDVGPLISEKNAQDTLNRIDEAVARGGRILMGGRKTGKIIHPTLLTDVSERMDIVKKEAFAPVVVVFAYKTITDALRRTNASPYGLQAGIFTQKLADIHRAHAELNVGGLMVNDVPTWRADHMPYGGAKESGVGREGPRYAIEEMTVPRLMSLDLS